MINVSVDCDPTLECPNKKLVINLVKSILNKNEIDVANISIIFGSDELLSNLKKKFFQKDHWTDVIAFRLNEYDEKDVEGEIYISIPRANENAKSFDEPFEREIARLIIHGCLHLVGFKDKSEKEKIEMTKKENNLLSLLNWHKLFET
jgi:probable rRNA maturation factor